MRNSYSHSPSHFKPTPELLDKICALTNEDSDEHKKAKLRIWLEQELPAWFGNRIKSIDTEVADRWGRLQAEMRRPFPAIDSLIAATALHFDLTVVTRNQADFSYPSLMVINPWDF